MNLHRNSDASVTSVSYYLNDTFWEVKLEPKTYPETVRGVVLGKPLSKVAVSICNGNHIHGEVFDGTDVYGLTYYVRQYVTRHPQEAGNSSNGISLYAGKKPETTPVRIAMGIVVDKTVFKEHDHSAEKGVDFFFSIVNILNALLAKFNIVLELTRIENWTDKDYIEMNSSSEVLLPRFNKYINSQMLGRDSVDFVVLYTANLSTEGVSIHGSMGSRRGSGSVVITNFHDVVVTAHTTLHELLHLFGVGHDQGGEDFLMAVNTNIFANAKVSKDSIAELNAAMPKTLDRLLQKHQQWTPISTGEQCGGPSFDPETEKGLAWWQISLIVFGALGVIVAVATVILMICKRRLSQAQPVDRPGPVVAYREIAKTDAEAVAMDTASESSVETKTGVTDWLSTSLAVSGVTDDRSIGMEKATLARESSRKSLTSGYVSPSQVSLTIEDDSS
ncbi:hypothetical protein pipiens_003290 [Culex pipiens pipiens]|uniref:Peptidase M12B domain-containing protein n=1 Tax=Culex pipiens pipiens TaxID=38569 RepID=A0ABD1D0S3_CULPP